MIDRSSLEPPYAQVARGMRERILSGEYQAGDRLPSEAELCALYGVSRMTVRRAVKLLAQDGVVYTENGRGTFVRAPELGAAMFDLGSLRRLVDDAATTVKISEARIVPPSPRVCRKLALDAESPWSPSSASSATPASRSSTTASTSSSIRGVRWLKPSTA